MAKTTHIIDWTSAAGIAIEPYPLASPSLTGVLAKVIIYPARRNLRVFTDYGSVAFNATTTNLIESEQVAISGSVNGSIASCKYRVQALVSVSGVVFDENNNEIGMPGFTVVNGQLKTSVECYGDLVVTYQALGDVYDYTAHTETPPGGGLLITTGVIMAIDLDAHGVAARYEVPAPTFSKDDKVLVARIYRELLIADKRYEMPTTFNSTTISYAHYPAANVSELDLDSVKIQKAQAEIWWNGVTAEPHDADTLIDWAYPTPHGSHFLDVKWQITESIPAGLSSSETADIQSKINALKSKYSIV